MKDKKISQKTFDRRQFYTNDDSGKIAIFAALIPYVISFVLSLLIGIFASAFNWDTSSQTSKIVLTVLSSLIPICSNLLVFFFYSKIMGINYRQASTISNKPKGWHYPLSIFIAVVMLLGPYLFLSLYEQLLIVMKYPLVGGLGLPMTNAGWLILNILLFGALPAITEELVFRGMVLQGLRKNFSDGKAIVFSALLFALFHGNLQQLPNPIIMGLIFGWLAIRTGSIWITMIAHFVNNMLVIILQYIFEHTGYIFGAFVNVWWYYLLAFGLAILTVVIIWLVDKFVFKKKNTNEIEKDVKAKTSPFVYVAFAVGAALVMFDILYTYLSKKPPEPESTAAVLLALKLH